MTIKSEITEAVDASVRTRNKLSTILHTSPDKDILVSRELLETLRLRLDNNATILSKCYDNIIEP